jgi:citronellol/citronellal dehydrogenase
VEAKRGLETRLKGKVAIVTGASRGLGKAIAIGFAREGASVAIAARTESGDKALPGTIHETAEEIQALGREALALKCDITDEQNVNRMAEAVLEKFGRIDVLVNNAAVAFYRPVLETPLKRWELITRVNLVGPFLCSKAVLPAMIKQRCGSIINISSLAADERDEGTVPTGVAYAVSKAGLDRMTWGLASEVGQYNIAVNALKPHTVVDTEGMRFWLKDADKSSWQSADMMVKAALFLACQDAKGVTGTVSTDREICAWHGLI